MNYTGFNEWAARWGVPPEALRELVSSLAAPPQPAMAGKSEAAVQQAVAVKAALAGGRLWRNNVGAYQDPDGRWVRYGLCNTSKRLNKIVKSSDLIGLIPVRVTHHHVGKVIGQFTAVEVKHGNWKPGKSDRELAQAKFMSIVRDMGDLAGFSTGELPS